MGAWLKNAWFSTRSAQNFTSKKFKIVNSLWVHMPEKHFHHSIRQAMYRIIIQLNQVLFESRRFVSQHFKKVNRRIIFNMCNIFASVISSLPLASYSLSRQVKMRRQSVRDIIWALAGIFRFRLSHLKVQQEPNSVHSDVRIVKSCSRIACVLLCRISFPAQNKSLCCLPLCTAFNEKIDKWICLINTFAGRAELQCGSENYTHNITMI